MFTLNPVAYSISSNKASDSLIMAAQTAAFATYELIENITSYLPRKDLSSARLACKDFNKVIIRSAKTRQTLVLQPAPISGVLLPTTTPAHVEQTRRLKPSVITELHPALREPGQDQGPFPWSVCPPQGFRINISNVDRILNRPPSAEGA